MEDTSAFTDRGVMVVTVAYRLGVFGFVGHPALSAEAGGSSGEYGVLDQIAALRWVRDNIAAFGGDPANVTLFGLSAGSFDAVGLMASPLSQGLMARAAVQGEVWWALNGKFNAIADAEQLGVGVAERVGWQPHRTRLPVFVRSRRTSWPPPADSSTPRHGWAEPCSLRPRTSCSSSRACLC